MRRIAHVSLGLDIGGQERLLVEFARHADRARFHLTFVSLTGRGRIANTLEDLGWPVHVLHEPPGFHPGLVWRLARFLKSLKCAVVHTHDDRPLLYASIAAKLARIPRHIHTQHHGLLPQMSRRQRRLSAWAGRLADVFVCVSEDSARHMALTGLPRNRITTVHNGIDLSRYPYQGPQAGGPAVTVARLSAEKDIATLLRATALVVASAPDFRLRIAGAGPLRDQLHQLAADLRLMDHVIFEGEVADIASFLANAAFFVLPSRTEGVSLTILEAMASGLAVAATNVGGNPEVIEDGSSGFLVPAADPMALAALLLRLWRQPTECRAAGLAARSRVETCFDSRVMSARYEHLYLNTLLPPSSRG